MDLNPADWTLERQILIQSVKGILSKALMMHHMETFSGLKKELLLILPYLTLAETTDIDVEGMIHIIHILQDDLI